MQLEVGTILSGKVTGITKFGAFVELPDGKTGMVHISEVAPTYVNDIRDHLTENQEVKVKVLNITEEGKISLSIKKAIDPPPQPARKPAPKVNRYDWSTPKKINSEPLSFEDMLTKFKQTSEDKMSDLKRNTENKRGSSGRRPR